MQRTLLHSASKLDSIVEIVQLEKQSQKKNLRMVILADYIYQDDLPKANEEAQPLIRLGVIPIFEKLRRQLDTSSKLGVLTGSVVIIPNETIHLLEEASLDFSVKQLDHDPHYALISWKGSSRQKMVKVMTDIFSNGDIDVLIGTTALLGEGWNAPSVNTLILASYVGSFMLTNQMRGRAIRTENGNEEKVANIWHLVCVDRGISDGGYDFQSLTRRFDSLTGVDAEIAVIQSGIQRLRMLAPPFRQQDIHETNKLMKNRATNRSRLFAKWREAVAKGEKKRIEMGVSQKKFTSTIYVPKHIEIINHYVCRNPGKCFCRNGGIWLLHLIFGRNHSNFMYRIFVRAVVLSTLLVEGIKNIYFQFLLRIKNETIS